MGLNLDNYYCDLISVIVPVYNVEKYLYSCIDSILAQTYNNLEIILIDDGSTDCSGKICDEYALKDSRILVIHKENQGLGLARNSGLEIAKGKYILFVDSDDYIHPKMVEELINNLVNVSADTCFCGYFSVYKNDLIEDNPAYYNDRIFKGNEIINEVLLNMIGGLPSDKYDTKLNMAVWHALYSTEIIKKNHLTFPSEREFISEDIIFHILYLQCAKKVYYISTPLYYYRASRIDSLTQRFDESEFIRHISSYNKLNSELSKILPSSQFQLRTQRYLLGRIRVCIQKSVYYKDSHKSFKLREHIKKTINDSTVREIIKKYPYKQNPFALKVFNFFLKIRFVSGIIFLVKLKQKHMNIK